MTATETALKGIPETMLIPLWARATETQREDAIIRDPKAVEMVGRIPYDFSRFEGARLAPSQPCASQGVFERMTARRSLLRFGCRLAGREV